MIAPTAVPDLYDFIVVQGIASPGIATVSGADRGYKWDVKEAKGSAGATTTFQGDGVAKPKVEFQLWLDEHFEAWDTFVQILKAAQGKNPTVLDVVHPVFQEHEIRSLVVENIGQVVHKGKGLYSITVSFLEYYPPKPKGGSPVASGWVDTTDKQDAELADLLAKAKAA